MSEGETPRTKTVVETLDEAFPYYLVMGMTYDQYWEQDCTMVKAYRKAFQIRQERENYMAWLHGMYIYEALCDVSPVMHAFAKSGTRPRPYAEKPYETEAKKPKEDTNAEKMRKTQNYMTELMARFNRGFMEKKVREEEGAVMTDV